MHKKFIFLIFLLSIIFLLVIFSIKGVSFLKQYNAFKKNDIGLSDIVPASYDDAINRFFKNASIKKKSFNDKNRNPIVVFKNEDSQIIYIHKLSVSNLFSLDSVILEKKLGEFVSDEIYNSFIYGSNLPMQVKLNSKIDTPQNKLTINFEGQILQKIEKNDSLLRFKIKFNSFSLKYGSTNMPDIYMNIDIGGSYKKFIPQTLDCNVVKSKVGFFLMLIYSTESIVPSNVSERTLQ